MRACASLMSRRNAAASAQAEVLIRAICDLRDKMIGQMNWLEKHDSCGRGIGSW